MASYAIEPATGCDLQFYPPKLWGLDYHFSVFNKMYICDILEMSQYPHFTGAFCYKNHPIYKVDVAGTIVKRVENSKCFIYAVDDGTGVVLCCCWKDSFYSKSGPSVPISGLPASLRAKMCELTEQSETLAQGYSLGDFVQFKGKLKLFREKKEVMASYHKKVEDPSFIVYRMCELPKLYRLRYDQPFQLPHKVQQALSSHKENSGGAVKTVSGICNQLKPVVYDILSKSVHLVDLPVADLLQYNKVKDILSNMEPDKRGHDNQLMILHTTLSLLEEEGHVARRNDRRMMFEVLLHKSKLEDKIKKLLITECKKPKYSEKGCHYLHILDELHRTLQYAKVKKEAVLYCLEKLEIQSDVIRSTQAHYLPCDV